jgi:hypothetical protein
MDGLNKNRSWSYPTYGEKEDKLISKKIQIYLNQNTADYKWISTNTVEVYHNLSGVVDYVLRYKNLNRILTTDKLLNNNTIHIVIPNEYQNNSNDTDIYFELTIYLLSSITYRL